MRPLLVFIIKAYRLLLSPIMASHCRFYPSCSHYAIEALEEHGALRGSYLTTRRLLRCHPFHPGGYDPVPPCNCSSSELQLIRPSSND